MKRTALRVFALPAILVIASLLSCTGCKPPAETGDGEGASSDNVLWRNELFDFAMEGLLNPQDEHQSAEMRQRMINRLDQWVRMQKPLEDWQPDPVIADTSEDLQFAAEQVLKLAEQIQQIQQGDEVGSVDNLPGDLRAAGERLAKVAVQLGIADFSALGSTMIEFAGRLDQAATQAGTSTEQKLRGIRAVVQQFPSKEFATLGIKMLAFSQQINPSLLLFHRQETNFALQEAVWLRDVASWAGGDELDDPVKPATALFDWVVRNVQLVSGTQRNGPQFVQEPWQTLLFGQGTAMERAWLYILLARQLNIDAALLGIQREDESGNVAIVRWAVGVLIEDEIYLFEPVLGLPIPKPGSWKLTDRGLTVEPATLAEAATDPNVLSQLGIPGDREYALKAEDLQNVVALVEAGPCYMSQRMKMVENQLTGAQKVVLTIDATAQMERFKKCKYVADAQIWPQAYQTSWQQIRGPERLQWLNARLELFIFPNQSELLWRARSLYFKGQFTGAPSATMLYQAARQSNFDLEKAEMDAEMKREWHQIKTDATYWLGLLMAETGNERAAEDYLKTRLLLASPGSQWEYGAAYNLARVYEVTGDIPTAVALYDAQRKSPQAQGNLVRAQWLRELSGMANEETEPDVGEPDQQTEQPSDSPPTSPETREQPSELDDRPAEESATDDSASDEPAADGNEEAGETETGNSSPQQPADDVESSQ